MFVQKWFLVFCLFLTLFSCKRYNLKQPAFISFNSEITSSDANSIVKIDRGAFYLDNIKVIGERIEGEAIEIDQVQSANKLTLAYTSSLGISMDIPRGDYTTFDVQLDLNENKLPAMELKGSFMKDGVTYPFTVFWRDNVKLSFLYNGIVSIKKKRTYETKLSIDQSLLMANIDWTDAVLTSKDGGTEMLVNAVTNEGVFEQITYNLKTALIFKIQE